MGALRASELADVGMIGVGKIFEMYLNGEIEGGRRGGPGLQPGNGNDPLSEPLVNIRATLALAVEEGNIGGGHGQSDPGEGPGEILSPAVLHWQWSNWRKRSWTRSFSKNSPIS